MIDTAHSIQVGLRGGIYSERDHQVPREMGMAVITGVEAPELGVRGGAERIVKRARGAKVFLSFDIDFIDPAYAPAAGTPEIGGFTPWQSQVLLRGRSGLGHA